jgi:S-formylglutathione hydrolase FrmB
MEIARVLPDWGTMKPELLATFGAAGPGNKHRKENDPFALAKGLDPKKAPAIYFDCGTEDGLLEGNRKLAKHLAKLGIKHEYQEYPGGHSWEYWELHVQEALVRHAEALGIGKR